MRATGTSALLLMAFAIAAAPASAQTSKFEKYQKMVGEDSPAELFSLVGADLWKKKQGPKNASLERCDLGKGPGVVKGAYAALPRYFKDTGQVMDAESRILYCMETLQGRSRKEALKRPFGNADKPSEMEYLDAYVASQSRGYKMHPGMSLPQEKSAYDLGKALFFTRMGLYDFSCASCHGEEGKRIRMSDLPVLSEPGPARAAMSTWPGYRVSNSQMKTMQWRINNCFRQMRTPEPDWGSEVVNSIITYLTVNAKGAVYAGPGTKR
jgi:L-cysteine S-thiosulfotransferase